ncbi:MAG: phosphate acyltransferase PlsX [Kiritimatiellaeota bacterium]|nr:phosphate acyltransferase PlsX [Kiritimatiellota bacterium]
MRIAIDAMGGDNAPAATVKGAARALASLPPEAAITLVGDDTAIRAELNEAKAAHLLGPRLAILHASQVITNDEPPAQAVRNKRDSSIYRGMELVKNGEADAILSAGSTGALIAAAFFVLRRLPGVRRPALGAVLPTIIDHQPLLVLDVGATTDCTETELEQFAMMGRSYSKAILRRANPAVGLLSIGSEDVKGNEVTKKTFELLKSLADRNIISFRGNVEGFDLFKGETDVLVCDGFAGNVLLKTVEGTAKAIGKWMKKEFTAGPIRLLGALCLSGAVRSMKRRMNPDVYAGAPLLGVNGTVIKTHGSSTEDTVRHAIMTTFRAVQNNLTKTIADELALLSPSAAQITT